MNWSLGVGEAASLHRGEGHRRGLPGSRAVRTADRWRQPRVGAGCGARGSGADAGRGAGCRCGRRGGVDGERLNDGRRAAGAKGKPAPGTAGSDEGRMTGRIGSDRASAGHVGQARPRRSVGGLAEAEGRPAPVRAPSNGDALGARERLATVTVSPVIAARWPSDRCFDHRPRPLRPSADQPPETQQPEGGVGGEGGDLVQERPHLPRCVVGAVGA